MRGKVSVVIPVYNVEKFLLECLQSFLNQSIEDYEIILVDDGSTDSSGVICDDFSMRYHNIHTIHKENGGLSSARNAGLRQCKTEFVTFVDSDDYVSSHYLEQMLNIQVQHNADVVICKLTEKTEGLTVGLVEKTELLTGKEAIADILKEKRFSTSACAKLFRTDMFDEILFPEGKIYEDFYTIPRILMKANTVAFVNSNIYYYRTNPDSITKIPFSAKRMQYFEVSDSLKDFFCAGNNDDLLKLLEMRKTRYAISFYCQLCKDNYENSDIEKKLNSIVRKNIFEYCSDSEYSLFSKMFGVLMATCPPVSKILAKLI